jgi:hypothetical protein
MGSVAAVLLLALAQALDPELPEYRADASLTGPLSSVGFMLSREGQEFVIKDGYFALPEKLAAEERKKPE